MRIDLKYKNYKTIIFITIHKNDEIIKRKKDFQLLI